MTKTLALDPELAFGALSDRTRLRLLNLLQDDEWCVCDLVDLLDVPQPTASRHLAVLRRAGLVAVHKQGLWCYYSLTPAAGAFHQHLLKLLKSSREELADLSADAARARKRVKSSCCDT